LPECDGSLLTILASGKRNHSNEPKYACMHVFKFLNLLSFKEITCIFLILIYSKQPLLYQILCVFKFCGMKEIKLILKLLSLCFYW